MLSVEKTFWIIFTLLYSFGSPSITKSKSISLSGLTLFLANEPKKDWIRVFYQKNWISCVTANSKTKSPSFLTTEFLHLCPQNSTIKIIRVNSFIFVPHPIRSIQPREASLESTMLEKFEFKTFETFSLVNGRHS